MTKTKKGNPRAKKNNMGGRKIKGRGNYSTFNLRGMAAKLDQALSSIPKGSFARKGAQMGAKYGPLGALAGKGLGAGLAAVTGYGNYSVRSNSLSKVSTSVDMIPQFVKNDHSVRVTHREFIKDLSVPNSPASFSNESFSINPANATLFPWLATLAKQYSQYKIHGMVFAYKSMSSDITAGGALGTIIMATNYNTIDRAFATKIEMENSEFAVSTKPSLSLVHAIECDPKYSGLDVLYVRDPSYETTDTSDRRFYDYGKFQLATSGLPGITGTTMGEIWVSYDIEFMKPIIGGNGLPLYTLGRTLVSRPNGATAVSSDGGEQVINFVGASLTPAASTAYSVSPTTFTVTGNTAIRNVVTNLDSEAVRFYKNGTYIVTYLGVGPTSASTHTLGAFANANLIAITTSPVGTAVVSSTNNGGGCVPHVCGGTTTIDGYQYAISYRFVVTGIVGTSGSVSVQTTNFTTHASALIASLVRTVRVSWTAFGSNQQDPSYIEG